MALLERLFLLGDRLMQRFLKYLALSGWGAIALAVLIAGIPVQNTHVIVPNTTMLAETSILAGSPVGYVTRATDGAANAPPMDFTGASGSCAASSLTNDGASCVDNTTEGSHWVGIFPGNTYDPRQFGAVIGGAADATTAMQAALNAAGATNGVLHLSGYLYGIDSSGLTCAAPVTIDGGNPNAQNTSATVGSGGFLTLSQNNTILTLASGCKGARIQNLYIGMEGFGENTSGAAISMSGYPSLVLMDNVSIYGPCIGIDLSGNSDWVTRSLIAQVQGGVASGCAGIRYGNYGGTANIGGGILTTTVQGNGNSTTTAEYGMQFVQVGGAYVADDDILYTYYGTALTPGASQGVQFFFGTNTVLGDTTASSPLYINPTSSSGKVVGFHCINCWMSTTSSGTEFGAGNTHPNAQILNSSSGTVTGIVLVGGWNYGGYDNMLIGTGVASVDVEDSHLCALAIGAASGTYYGVELQTDVSHAKFLGDTISPSCDGQTGGSEAAGYAFGFDSGTQTGVTIIGNDLAGNISGPYSGTPTYTNGTAVSNEIVNNSGVVGQGTTSSATTVAITTPTDNVTLSGTTTVETLTQCWPGRELWINSTGNTPFGTSGNIKNALTMTAGTPVLGKCTYGGTGNPGIWWLVP
jgi:hypothetical protein